MEIVQLILVALVVGVISYLLLMVLFPSVFGSKKTAHTRNALLRIMEDGQSVAGALKDDGVLKEDLAESPALAMVASLPMIGERAVEVILQSGMGRKAGNVVVICLLVMLVSFLLLNGVPAFAGIPALILAGFGSVYITYKNLMGKIKKRRSLFIEMFPDVLDMIVRSIRSGFPLNTAIKLVSESMEPPISSEFKQVSDEVALGRPLNHALARLAERIPEPDIRFFVVVLNVQQETGGNLAEVLTNLSTVIRKRKQLMLKTKAMTSEARATGWVLGSLPVVLTCILWYLAPNHLTPFFDSNTGLMWFSGAVGLMLLAFFIIRQMIDIDI